MTAPMTQRPAQLESLKPFEGVLIGRGRAFASPMAPEHPVNGRFAARWVLDGMWLSSEWTEERTDLHPMPMNGLSQWGYDSSTGQYVAVWVDGFGALMTGSSPGWQGDDFVWTWSGTMMGAPAQIRGTWTRQSGRIARGSWEANLGQGWMPMMEMSFESG
jgi:hypothetical protein